MRDTLTRQQRRAAQLRGRGWSLTEIAKELGISTRTLVRWNRLPAFRGEQARTRDERDAEQPLSLRQTLEAALLATKGDGSPDWTPALKPLERSPRSRPRRAIPSRRCSRSASSRMALRKRSGAFSRRASSRPRR